MLGITAHCTCYVTTGRDITSYLQILGIRYPIGDLPNGRIVTPPSQVSQVGTLLKVVNSEYGLS